MGQHASTVAHDQDTSVECSLGVLPSQVDRTQKQAHKSVFVDAPSAAANWAEESWALGSGLWAPSSNVGGSRQSGASLTWLPGSKTERSGCLAGRSRAPAWANVRNVRRCNVRPQGVSKPDSRVSISLSRLSPFLLRFSTGCRGSHSCTSVLSCQLRLFAFSLRHDFSGGPAFMTPRLRLSRPSRATDPQSKPDVA